MKKGPCQTFGALAGRCVGSARKLGRCLNLTNYHIGP